MILFEAMNAGKQIDGADILNNITIQIAEGEKVAIVGHNGSGKSSLLKLIGGIYENTSGQVKREKFITGYVPEHFPENIRFTIKEYLLLIGKMSGKTEGEIIKVIYDYSELFSITAYLNTPLKNCSKGTKQKAGIIQAMLTPPELFLLDEPLTGLDEPAQKQMLNILNSFNQRTSIVFTAHESLLVDGLAERVITIANGTILSDEKKRINEKIYMIKAIVPNKEIVSTIDCVHMKYQEGNIIEWMVFAEQSDEVLIKLLNNGCKIIELKEKR
ncbi:ABC-type multidrug transport system ATPase subunit [Cytobacillus eiseniae]|uniref:ABC-type multidrug transport system ATPase subunit n=1 Tax=Cytobacillus eiseniae TaxID=762947 RepID=A0ABS4RIT1_9BACI|nr:ABC transporter ATP-binding protein [Cytobacillus eiseniae]MBP2242810.1 ABC-type multidrug transport system ATPase subunit [Cytobacillus eiseniae]